MISTDKKRIICCFPPDSLCRVLSCSFNQLETKTKTTKTRANVTLAVQLTAIRTKTKRLFPLSSAWRRLTFTEVFQRHKMSPPAMVSPGFLVYFSRATVVFPPESSSSSWLCCSFSAVPVSEAGVNIRSWRNSALWQGRPPVLHEVSADRVCIHNYRVHIHKTHIIYYIL